MIGCAIEGLPGEKKEIWPIEVETTSAGPACKVGVKT
jgi:hypothetical protein